MYLGIYLSTCLPIYLSIDLSIIWIYRSTWLFYETPFFQVGNIKNAALLQDFLILWSWPHQTESNSARPPPFFRLTTSKTKQFCETSFIFELNNVKNEAILRDFFIFHTWQHQNKAILRHFLQKWKVECSADSLVPTRFAIFPLHLMPGHTKCRTCHVKSS